jgi:hypothetical protein
MADRNVQDDSSGPPPRKRRLSKKAWLVIVAVIFGMALIGSLLPDRPAEKDAAPVPSERPSARYTISGQQGTSPDRSTGTPSASPAPAPAAAPVDLIAEANEWWFNGKGFLIGGYIEDLSAYVTQTNSGELTAAAVTCSRLQNRQVSAIPVPNAVFGQDVVAMFDMGTGFLLVAADNCQKFFEDNDVQDLQQSLQAAGDAANALNGVRTEIFEKHIKQP